MSVAEAGLEPCEESSGKTPVSARGGAKSDANGAETDAIVAPADVGGTDPLTNLTAASVCNSDVDLEQIAAELRGRLTADGHSWPLTNEQVIGILTELECTFRIRVAREPHERMLFDN